MPPGPPHCFGSVKFCVFLSARLDALGAPDPGSSNLYVSDAGIEMSVKPKTDEGETLEQENGCGQNYVELEEPDTTSRVDLGLTVAALELELFEMLTAGILEQTASVSVGFALPDPSAAAPNGVVIEAYAIAMNGKVRAPHPISGDPAWWRYRFPHVTWAMGDNTLSNSVLAFAWNGKSTSNPSVGLGPFGTWPTAPPGPFAFDIVDELPEVACGYQELEAVPS